MPRRSRITASLLGARRGDCAVAVAVALFTPIAVAARLP